MFEGAHVCARARNFYYSLQSKGKNKNIRICHLDMINDDSVKERERERKKNWSSNQNITDKMYDLNKTILK